MAQTHKRIKGYILEQFPRTKDKNTYFKVYRLKKFAEQEIIGMRDGKPEIYKVEIKIKKVNLT